MPNITPEEIAEAIAEVLETSDGYGMVITDKRFAESNIELSRLLKGQADTGDWRGWVLTWVGILSQVEDGPCEFIVSYTFALKFFHFYENESTEGNTSEISFKRALFSANEALNASRDLGFGAGHTIRHLGLESAEEFTVEDLGGGSVSQICHSAIFTLGVEVLNHYED